MKSALLKFVLILSATVVMASGLATSAGAVEQKDVTLRWAFAGPPKGVLAEWTKWTAEEITRRTGGKVKIEFFWSGSLLGFKDIMHGVGKGTAHLGTASGMFTLTEHPHWSTLGLPGTGTDLWALIRAAYETMHGNAHIMSEFNKLNLAPTYGYVPGTTIYVFKKPVTTLEDMKGLRVRGYGAPQCKLLSELGMVPVVMGIFGVYESMGRGVIDGAVGTPQFMHNLKWYEVAKHFTESSNGNCAADVTTVINKGVWDSFTQNTRDVIKDVTFEFQDKYVRALMESEAVQIKNMETEQGVRFDKLAPEADAAFLKAAKVARDDWFKKWDSQGVETKAVYDQLIEKVTKYQEEVKEKGYPWDR